jgi:hypothetical protein
MKVYAAQPGGALPSELLRATTELAEKTRLDEEAERNLLLDGYFTLTLPLRA